MPRATADALDRRRKRQILEGFPGALPDVTILYIIRPSTIYRIGENDGAALVTATRTLKGDAYAAAVRNRTTIGIRHTFAACIHPSRTEIEEPHFVPSITS